MVYHSSPVYKNDHVEYSNYSTLIAVDYINKTNKSIWSGSTEYGMNYDNEYIRIESPAWNDKHIIFKKDCIKYKQGVKSVVHAGAVSENIGYMGNPPAITYVFY